ncbi:hypothetical protein [Streptomyces sp. NPDC093591]|uniref:hypothetical protein n=1 Tax=Streptomyces sp. NPDC093591 TaxID=3366044 RepID=UPI00380CDBBE
MGFKPVYDYRADQLGKQAGTHGAILVAGRWCRGSLALPRYRIMPKPPNSSTAKPGPTREIAHASGPVV